MSHKRRAYHKIIGKHRTLPFIVLKPQPTFMRVGSLSFSSLFLSHCQPFQQKASCCGDGSCEREEFEKNGNISHRQQQIIRNSFIRTVPIPMCHFVVVVVQMGCWLVEAPGTAMETAWSLTVHSQWSCAYRAGEQKRMHERREQFSD